MVAPYLATPTAEVLHPLGDFALATVQITDYDHAGRPASMAKQSTSTSDELTAELDGATEWLGLPAEEILLAALTRTVARTLGEGVVPVDIASQGSGLLDAVPMVCTLAHRASATEILGAVHRALTNAPQRLASDPAEVYFNYIGEVPERTVPVRETPPGRGHALEIRVYRTDDDLHVDWWYDTTRFESYTVTELAEQFPHALFEMTSDALPPV